MPSLRQAHLPRLTLQWAAHRRTRVPVTHWLTPIYSPLPRAVKIVLFHLLVWIGNNKATHGSGSNKLCRIGSHSVAVKQWSFETAMREIGAINAQFCIHMSYYRTRQSQFWNVFRRRALSIPSTSSFFIASIIVLLRANRRVIRSLNPFWIDVTGIWFCKARESSLTTKATKSSKKERTSTNAFSISLAVPVALRRGIRSPETKGKLAPTCPITRRRNFLN